MNKLERMTGILLILSRKGKVRAVDLADLYEVSERTIYRDVQALGELGVPVIAETGSGGGYSLAQGYFAEPVVLDRDECQAIILGCGFIAGQSHFPLAAPAQRALTKLEAVMPIESLEEARSIAGRVNWELKTSAVSKKTLDQLREALVTRKTVSMLYQSLEGEPSWRDVDVYELNYANQSWYINGFCHKRGDVRQFKAVRIQELRLTDRSFLPQEYTRQQVRPPGPESVVRVSANTVRGKMLTEDPFLQGYLRTEGDYHIITLPAREFSPGFVLRFVLSLGRDGELLDPPEMRELLAAELDMLQKLYSTQS